jgi:hypothetical protein
MLLSPKKKPKVKVFLKYLSAVGVGAVLGAVVKNPDSLLALLSLISRALSTSP